MEWEEKARCANINSDLFFPDQEEKNIEKARVFCNQCEVKTKCLEVAQQFRLPGIWGGTTTAQRKNMRTYFLLRDSFKLEHEDDEIGITFDLNFDISTA